jgi:hypothetical protein
VRSTATPAVAVCDVATTTVLLATGETLEVAGSVDQVAKQLENAARSSAGTLAWLDEPGRGERLGVNPAQVVWIRKGDD